MKRSELLFSVLLVPIDALMVFLAFVLSYYTRVESGALPVSYVLPFSSYVKVAAAITLVWLVIFALLGLYRLRSTRRGLNEFSRIAAGVTVGTLTVIAVIFFLRVDFFSRLVILFAFVSGLILVSAARALIRVGQRYLFRYGIGVRRVILVGESRQGQVLAEELSRRGYRILGHVRTGRARGGQGKKPLGTLADLPRLIKRLRPDELIDVDPNLSGQQKLDLINLAEDAHIDISLTSDITDLATARVNVAAVAGVPLVTVQRTPLEGWGRVLKRLTDIVGAVIALPFIVVLLPFIALAIKLNSRGPVIFKQVRVGRAGKRFVSYKFRTMRRDAERQLKKLQNRNEVSGPIFKIKDDPRITRVGRFLRKTSLDELPQFFNVLAGDMSLVGPRPPLPREVAKYGRTERRRLTIKPGITGPWQVSGRSDVEFDEWVRLDVYYIQNWSMLLDCTILLKTVGAVVSRKGAY